MKLLSRIILVSLMVVGIASGSTAREAAFMEPGAGGAGASEEAVKVDPKAEIDVGETVIGVAKHASVFFVNQTALSVKIEKVVVNNDANVSAEAIANDCMKLGSIEAASRCSVEVSITPSSPGAWSVDILMTHNGAGRITRARLIGKTAGSASSDAKTSGLVVSGKDTKPVEFGDVTVGDGKIVRSTLMVNDSGEPITLYSIDVIEADNGLQRLDQGCAVDMELAPGASCPVTLVWLPKSGGPVSTDLIIRHSGRLGFAVIPIRGLAKGNAPLSFAGNGSNKTDPAGHDVVPLPPSAKDLENEVAGRVAPVSSAALSADTRLHLIGTVGSRGVFMKPDGDTEIVEAGGSFDSGGKTIKLVSVNVRSASLLIGKERKDLPLEAASSLVTKAQQAQADALKNDKGGQSVKLDPGAVK